MAHSIVVGRQIRLVETSSLIFTLESTTRLLTINRRRPSTIRTISKPFANRAKSVNGGTVFAKSRACKSSLREREREARFADENIHRSSDKLSSLFARNYLCPPTKTTARLSRILRGIGPRSINRATSSSFEHYVPYRSLAYMPIQRLSPTFDKSTLERRGARLFSIVDMTDEF